MSNKQNIEDFLKGKFAEQHSGQATDWNSFEKKLGRALWVSRVRSVAALSLFALALFAGFNHIQDGGSKNAPWNKEFATDFEPYILPETSGNEEPIDLGEVVFVSPKKEKVQNTDGQTIEPDQVVKNQTTDKNTVPLQANESATPSARANSAKAITSEKSMSGVNQGAEENTDVAQKIEDKSALAVTEENTSTNNKAIPNLPGKSFSAQRFFKSLKAFEVRSNGSTPQLKNRFAGIVAPEYSGYQFGTPRSIRGPIASLGALPKPKKYISHLQAKNPWSYSINVYPNFTFRKFKVDEKKHRQLHLDFVDAIQESESRGFSLNVGLEVSKRIGDITYLNGGVEYISYNTNAVFSFTNFREANISDETGEIQNYSIREFPEDIVFKDENSYHYLNFPLSVSYQPWASSHIRLNIEVGGSLMYFVGAQGKTIDYTTLEIMNLSDREYRKFLGSFSIKAGANYYLTERINFGFEPTLVYFTNTIYTEDMPFYVIPYSVGLNVHMQVKLN